MSASPSPTPSDSAGRTRRSSSSATGRTRPSPPIAGDEPGALPLGEIQERIGYRFSDPALLVQALTHRSFSQESTPPEPDNERLEFLGDAVLQLVVTERLWRGEPEADEGRLTRLRSARVSGRALSRVAREAGLASYLRLGRGEEKTGGRKKPSILSNTFEALTGAVYLDGGYADCAAWVESWLWREGAEEGTAGDGDFKGRLQEIFQRRGLKPPVYRVVSESGPEHSKVFEVEVRHEGAILGRGKGPNKKAAEQAAARESLDEIGGG